MGHLSHFILVLVVGAIFTNKVHSTCTIQGRVCRTNSDCRVPKETCHKIYQNDHDHHSINRCAVPKRVPKGFEALFNETGTIRLQNCSWGLDKDGVKNLYYQSRGNLYSDDDVRCAPKPQCRADMLTLNYGNNTSPFGVVCVCPDTHYLKGNQTACKAPTDINCFCQKKETWPPGEGAYFIEGNGVANHRPCPENTWNDGKHFECKPGTDCKPGEVERFPPTRSRNRMCAPPEVTDTLCNSSCVIQQVVIQCPPSQSPTTTQYSPTPGLWSPADNDKTKMEEDREDLEYYKTHYRVAVTFVAFFVLTTLILAGVVLYLFKCKREPTCSKCGNRDVERENQPDGAPTNTEANQPEMDNNQQRDQELIVLLHANGNLSQTPTSLTDSTSVSNGPITMANGVASLMDNDGGGQDHNPSNARTERQLSGNSEQLPFETEHLTSGNDHQNSANDGPQNGPENNNQHTSNPQSSDDVQGGGLGPTPIINYYNNSVHVHNLTKNQPKTTTTVNNQTYQQTGHINDMNIGNPDNDSSGNSSPELTTRDTRPRSPGDSTPEEDGESPNQSRSGSWNQHNREAAVDTSSEHHLDNLKYNNQLSNHGEQTSVKQPLSLPQASQANRLANLKYGQNAEGML